MCTTPGEHMSQGRVPSTGGGVVSMVDENDAAERGVSRTSEAQAADPNPTLTPAQTQTQTQPQH
eukprot:scaffold23195_cov76-Phaeocystis_antarctica.AAC.4